MYCTFNVTEGRVSVTTGAVKIQYVSHILSVCLYVCLSYPACPAYSAVLCCHLWPVWIYHISLTYSMEQSPS